MDQAAVVGQGGQGGQAVVAVVAVVDAGNGSASRPAATGVATTSRPADRISIRRALVGYPGDDKEKGDTV